MQATDFLVLFAPMLRTLSAFQERHINVSSCLNRSWVSSWRSVGPQYQALHDAVR